MGIMDRLWGLGPDKMVCKPPNIWADDRIFFAWQRSHMANERTFLAWSRTSISLLAFGFVIEKFELFMHQLAQLGGYAVSIPTRQEHDIFESLLLWNGRYRNNRLWMAFSCGEATPQLGSGIVLDSPGRVGSGLRHSDHYRDAGPDVSRGFWKSYNYGYRSARHFIRPGKANHKGTKTRRTRKPIPEFSLCLVVLFRHLSRSTITTPDRLLEQERTGISSLSAHGLPILCCAIHISRSCLSLSWVIPGTLCVWEP